MLQVSTKQSFWVLLMLALVDLFWITTLLCICWYWWRALGMKEVALASTRRYCQKMGVELLDDTVVLRAFWLKRDPRGRVCMWRRFHFEFTSTGEERYLGRIVLLGNYVETIQLQPHRWG